MKKRNTARKRWLYSKNIFAGCMCFFIFFSLLFTSFSVNAFGDMMDIPVQETERLGDLMLPSNNPPTAHIESITPSPATFGETVCFNGHGDDIDGTIVGWQWDSSIDGVLSTVPSFTTSDLSVGMHEIFFKVKDDDNKWSADVMQILIINDPPVADAGEEPYFGWKNKAITFDGSRSSDTDGAIIMYEWDFGDGFVEIGEITTHTYSSVGTYTVKLTVEDNYGGADTVITSATIVGNSPIANTDGPYFGYVDQSIVFNGSNSSDIDGTIIAYSWDFGDGTNGTGELVNHSYNTSGNYTVNLTVTDDDGATDIDITYAVVTRANSPLVRPEVNVTAGDSSNKYIFTAVSTDPDNDMIRYIFDWDDGTNTTSPFFPSGILITASHIWASPGIYNVRIYAEDENGATSEEAELPVLISDTSDLSSDGSLGHGLYGQTSGGTHILNEGEIEQISSIIMVIIIVVVVIIAVITSLYRKEYF